MPQKAMNYINNKISPLLLIITVIAVIVPFSPIMPNEGLDSSWVLGMNQAYSQGLVFGRDIIFTFGPYSSIYTKAFHPATDALMIIGSLFFAVMFAYVAYECFRDSALYIKISFVIVISTFLYTRDVLLFLYPYMVGIYIHDKLRQEIDFLIKARGVKLFLLFSVFGLLPLIKGSTIFLCLAIIFLCVAILLVEQRFSLAFILCISPIFSLVVFWGISGQPIDAIPDYFISMMPIISGYTDAMAVDGKISEVILYLLSAFSIVVVLFFNMNSDLLRGFFLLSISGVLMFLAFKAGFVRHDGHALNAGLTILLVGLLMAKYFNGTRLIAVLLLPFMTWVAIHVHYNSISFEVAIANFANTYADLWKGGVKRIRDSNALNEEYRNRLDIIASHANLGKIDGLTDIYSYDQASLIASGNNWSPRPILQSYSVYTPELALRNSNYLAKIDAPDSLLLKIQPIDGRLPSLEDGSSWPLIYSNYQYYSYNNGYLALKKKENSYINERSGVEVNKKFGEKVMVEDEAKIIFAKIKIKKTLIGKFVSFIFKPSELQITLNLKGGEVKVFRLIAGMAESGFVISPHIESEVDFILGFAGDKYLMSKKVDSFVIDSVNFGLLWNKSYSVQLNELNFEFVDALKFLKTSSPINVDSSFSLNEAKRCDGAIDEIDGLRVNKSNFKAGAIMKITGWLAPSIDSSDQHYSTYIVLESQAGGRAYFKVEKAKRSDVSLAFHRNLDHVGYKSILNLSGYSGDYFLRLAYQRGNAMYLCPMQKYSLRIAND